MQLGEMDRRPGGVVRGVDGVWYREFSEDVVLAANRADTNRWLAEQMCVPWESERTRRVESARTWPLAEAASRCSRVEHEFVGAETGGDVNAGPE